ncbi:unnamed protein product [Rhizophagus irregularis]|nr:unnamed protein product [Rhizophagus irregularis]
MELVVATSSSEESDHLQDPDYLSNSLSSHSSKCSFIKSGFLSGYRHDLTQPNVKKVVIAIADILYNIPQQIASSHQECSEFDETMGIWKLH